MRWEDERYVRLYTRDSADWLGLSFLAQGLFCLLLRKVDRAGILPLGRAGKKGAAVAVGHGHQWPMLEPALDELLEDGCVRMDGDHLVIPNFIEAQEAIQSDAARKRTQRERDRARVTLRDESVTTRDDESRNGTKSHEMSREVTPSLAVPSLTEPPQVPDAASDFVRWLAETYPDIRDPVAFEKAQTEANPGIDLLSEAKRARAWELSNRGRAKRDHGRYLNGWFSRAQDGGGRRGAPAAGPVTEVSRRIVGMDENRRPIYAK